MRLFFPDAIWNVPDLMHVPIGMRPRRCSRPVGMAVQALWWTVRCHKEELFEELLMRKTW
jgi:hypothetical protein